MEIQNPCPNTLGGVPGHLFVSLVNTLFASQCLLSTTDLYPIDYGPRLQDDDDFDFIVVGGGSAGSIVASRLSEIANWRVLLLEAGRYPSAMSEIPKTTFTSLGGAEDWSYETETSQTACLGYKDQRCLWPRGKGLGGSGLLNGMLYIRGHRGDFDGWAEAGNDGWDYDSVLSHFQKFEDLQEVEDDLLGKGGELKLTRYEGYHPTRKVLIDAYQELGYGKYTEKAPVGYLDVYTNIWQGTRLSASKAFLPQAKSRKNFYLALNAHVTKVLVDKNLFVNGVEVRIGDKIIKLKSSKEVILSAGSINSPQILMNSGIGPEEHLKEVGVPVFKNLKVGYNLRDHIIFNGLAYEISDDALYPQTPSGMIDGIYQYFRHRTGPLARSGVENFHFFADTKNISKYPNTQFYYFLIYKNDLQNSLKLLQAMRYIPDDLIALLTEVNKNSAIIFLSPSISQPKSVGRVLLRSSDPFDKPKILANYLSDESGEDLGTFVEALRLYQKVAKTKAFSHLHPKLLHLEIQLCSHHKPDSDEYWKCAMRNGVTSIYHPVGSCKMGPNGDPDAVVDPRLRVHGVKGLRVIDGSIIPKMHSCNTNAAIMMIGEKGAAMIREDWTKGHTEL